MATRLSQMQRLEKLEQARDALRDSGPRITGLTMHADGDPIPPGSVTPFEGCGFRFYPETPADVAYLKRKYPNAS